MKKDDLSDLTELEIQEAMESLLEKGMLDFSKDNGYSLTELGKIVLKHMKTDASVKN